MRPSPAPSLVFSSLCAIGLFHRRQFRAIALRYSSKSLDTPNRTEHYQHGSTRIVGQGRPAPAALASVYQDRHLGSLAHHPRTRRVEPLALWRVLGILWRWWCRWDGHFCGKCFMCILAMNAANLTSPSRPSSASSSMVVLPPSRSGRPTSSTASLSSSATFSPSSSGFPLGRGPRALPRLGWATRAIMASANSAPPSLPAPVSVLWSGKIPLLSNERPPRSHHNPASSTRA